MLDRAAGNVRAHLSLFYEKRPNFLGIHFHALDWLLYRQGRIINYL